MKRNQSSAQLHDNNENKEAKKMKKFLATDAKLNYPSGVFVTPNDEVFIADFANNRVRKIRKDGTIVTIAGNGEEGFSGDGGPATDAELNTPLSVFVSSQNEVYMVDYNNYRIRKIKTDGTIITIAGNGEEGFSGDGGLAINAQISNVESIYVSENDEIYLADFDKIRKILKNGNIITIAGNGDRKYVGDGVIATETGLNGPESVFISQNGEIYISDSGNNCIRKILNDGKIITIAGTGGEGFSGDGGLAINAKLSCPGSLAVSSNNEIYFVDRKNFRIRKILKNGNIETVAGTGEEGFSGDNGLAINAQISYIHSLYISENDELYIADSSNNRIRKVLRNRTIITIAGNGEEGYSGDSPFDFSLNPHIGYRANYISNNRKLKKHSRDEIFGFELIGFIPLIEKLSPQFCKIILKNEMILKSMNSQQLQIIQKLIDSLIYEKSSMICDYFDSLDILLILGMFKNCEFINLKRRIVSEFIKSITIESLPFKWEQVEKLIQICKEVAVNNYILEVLNTYCLEYSAIQLRNPTVGTLLKSSPMILRNFQEILSCIDILDTTTIKIEEEIEIESKGIESLFNDEKTSDVKIKMGQDKYLYCHKTILTSKSTFFNALFESGSTFSDLSQDGIFTPDESEDLNLLEIVIKSCYEIDFEINESISIVELLDIALKHENQYLIDECKKRISITKDNYFKTASTFEKYFHLECFENLFNELLKFGISNCDKLFTDCDTVNQLPEQLRNALFIQFAQIIQTLK